MNLYLNSRYSYRLIVYIYILTYLSLANKLLSTYILTNPLYLTLNLFLFTSFIYKDVLSRLIFILLFIPKDR